MATLNAAFTFDLESNMQVITERTYNEINAKNWWPKVGKEVPLRSKRERLIWFLEASGIDYTGDRFGSNVEFEDLATASMELVYQSATKGFRLNRNAFEDLDGNGVNAATEWATQQGYRFAYWPQQQMASLIKSGTTVLGFDGVSFFNVAHPNHMFDSTAGVYCNWFKGSASGPNPGALPIDESVTADVALVNLSKAIAQIALVPMADGVTPRNLKVTKILVPSKLVTRATVLTDAKFLAGAASSGGGSFDVSALVARWGLEVVEASELSAAYGGSDTTYYLVAEQASSSRLGALIYGVRRPFSIQFNSGITDAQLQIDNGLQWVTRGENITAPGLPYYLYRVDAT